MAMDYAAYQALNTTFVRRHTSSGGAVSYETPEAGYGGTMIKVVEIQQDAARDRLVLSLADGAVLAREWMDAGSEFQILTGPPKTLLPDDGYGASNPYSNQLSPLANQMQAQSALGQMEAQAQADQYSQIAQRQKQLNDLAKMKREQEQLRYQAMVQQQWQNTPVERPADPAPGTKTVVDRALDAIQPIVTKPAEPARPVWPPRIEIDID